MNNPKRKTKTKKKRGWRYQQYLTEVVNLRSLEGWSYIQTNEGYTYSEVQFHEAIKRGRVGLTEIAYLA